MRTELVETATASAKNQPSAESEPNVSGPRRSLFRYGPALILIAVAIADSQRLADSDLWGHVRFGQWLLAGRGLPTRDAYSYSAAGHLWINHEWLAEWLMAFAYNRMGIVGLKLLKLACSAATIMFMAAAFAETGAPLFWQFATLIVISVSIAPVSQFRPQMFTFALFAATMALLSRDRYRGRALLWSMLVIMLLWVNLHGGFIMGIAAFGLYSAATLAEGLILGSHRTNGRIAILALAVTAITLLNPYGLGMWEGVLHALRNPHTGRIIVDWQPLLHSLGDQWRLHPSGTVYIALSLMLFVGLAVAWILAPDVDDWPIAAIALVMIAAAFVAVRNYPLAELAVAPPLLRRIAMISAGRPVQVTRHGARNSVVLGFMGLAMLVFSGLLSERLVSQDAYPAGAVRYIKDHKLPGNLLAPFDWGEYVIWHLYPQNRVFIDGRYDTVYPASVIDDYLKYHFDMPGADAVLRNYPHDLILVDRKMPALRLIQSSADWLAVYQDSASVLFERASKVSHSGRVPMASGEPSNQFP